jgi:hypothetical protein
MRKLLDEELYQCIDLMGGINNNNNNNNNTLMFEKS